MYTKTGFGLLAAAGVAVGVIGMTMGGASSAPSAMCEPSSGTSTDSASASGSGSTTARPVSADTSGANSNANNSSNANGANSGPTGPEGPQGPNGPAGTDDDDNGTDPNGSTGPDGSTGTNGLSGIHINAKGNPKADDDTTGSLSVRDYGSTVPRRVRSGSSILDVRSRSNATSAPISQAPASGTHGTGTSTLLGGLNINGHVNDGH